MWYISRAPARVSKEVCSGEGSDTSTHQALWSVCPCPRIRAKRGTTVTRGLVMPSWPSKGFTAWAPWFVLSQNQIPRPGCEWCLTGSDFRKLRRHGKRMRGEGESQFHVFQEWLNAGALGQYASILLRTLWNTLWNPTWSFPLEAGGLPKPPSWKTAREVGSCQSSRNRSCRWAQEDMGALGRGSSTVRTPFHLRI